MTYFERAGCSGVPVEDAEAALHRPDGQVANQLAYSVCGLRGVAFSRDVAMAIQAQLAGLRPVGLEDRDWVASHRARIPIEVYVAGIKWILRRSPTEVLEEIVSALNMGDYQRIAELVRRSFGNAQFADIVHRIMVVERNQHWMPRLERQLDAGNAVALVGAAHLPGPDGLIALLGSRGYRVEAESVPYR